MIEKRHVVTSVALASMALISLSLGAQAGEPLTSATATADRPFELLATDTDSDINREVEVFVRFDVPSVAEYCVAEHKRVGRLPSASMQRAHAGNVDAQQASIRAALAASGARELSSLRVGANGLRVMVPQQNLAMLKQLPGVRSVAPVTLHTIENAQSVPWIGAPEFWAALGTGEGVSIGVIDTGIDYTHANFGGPGTSADYVANNPDVIEVGTFPTSKVVGGYDFVGTKFNASDPLNSTPIPDNDPLDENGHGSHVSGTAAGLGIGGIIGPGVAPGADLYALKVFGASGSTSVTSDAIEWAMDPNGDGDTSDHLDVINMSLGSPFGSPDDPSSIAAQNAADLGIIVVTSAGNAGNRSYITGSPGVTDGAISTAASTKGGEVPAIAVSGDVNDLIEAVEGTSPVQLVTAPVSGPLSEPATANITACSPIMVDMNDSIALISRGGCSFATKFANASAAGAVGIIVYNDGATPARIAPFVMGGLGAATLPGVMIPSTQGADLSAQLASGSDIAALLDVNLKAQTALGDLIAGFSSRGPGVGGSGFKPDVTSPGVAIVSTLVGSGAGAVAFQGTSMASPHTAGVAALLRQQHPDLHSSAIKALIQNSTVDMNSLNDAIQGMPLQLTRMGVGRVSISNAMSLSSYAVPGGVSFGYLNPEKEVESKRKVKVTSLDGRRNFRVTHVANQTMSGVTVKCPESVKVPARGEKQFKIELKIDPEQMPFDTGGFTQNEVDGWCVLDDGDDTLRVGYIAVIDPASVIKVEDEDDGELNISNHGEVVGFAEGFTMTGRGGDALDKASHAIKSTGFRTANPAAFFGFPVMELAVVTEEPWDTMRDIRFDYFIDVDFDGVADARLSGVNWAAVSAAGADGTMVTAQFDLVNGGGFLDWFVSTGDFNDQSVALPFTKTAFGGLVPDVFDYVLVTTGRDGSSDIQFGTVDTAREIIPDTNSFGLPGDAEVTVKTTGTDGGRMLWLFQQNRAGKQADVVRVSKEHD